MAWNEPGGGDKKDPWGNGNDQGPPDLDEAFKKLKQKLDGVLGGGSGGSQKNSGGFNFGLLIIALVILGFAWVAQGIYQIDAKERGVILRFGKFYKIEQPGLHWNPPLIDKVYKVAVTRVRAYQVKSASMLTEDQNIVEVSLSVQYTASDPEKFLLKVRDPELSLAHATESALRHVVGSSEMHQILTEGRAELAIEVQKRLQQYLQDYDTGIDVVKVNIDDTRPPQPVQAAFDDVIKAKEDEERLKNEAEAYRNGIIPEARGYAQRQLEEANGYKQQVEARAEGEASRFSQLVAEYEQAPEVTRRRLYLDTMEKVLSGTSKVVVDVEGGNNMMYLPLDQLIQKAQTTSKVDDVNSMASERNLRQLNENMVRQLRRQSNNRTRERR